MKALGEGAEVQAPGQRSGGQHTVLRHQAEVRGGRLEGSPPRVAAAAEALGQGRGARGQPDQEGRLGLAVAQLRRGGIGRQARRAALPHLLGHVLRPGRSRTAHTRSSATPAAHRTAKSVPLACRRIPVGSPDAARAAALARSSPQLSRSSPQATANSPGRCAAQRFNRSRQGMSPSSAVLPRLSAAAGQVSTPPSGSAPRAQQTVGVPPRSRR